jgi:sugar O-acyltransferase (sialic acid O-acetyltransferase NeuD family)
MTDRRALLVLGTTAFAVEIADIAREAGHDVTGFVENLDPTRCDAPLDGRPVHWIDDVDELAGTHDAVCGIGTTRRSIFVDQAAARGLRFTSVVHPRAHVSSTATLGEGTIVSAGAVVGAHTRIGRHVMLNRGCLVGHHTEVGDFVSLQAGSNVAGSCRIGAATFVAMGAVVVDHLSIGEGCLVAAGAVVVGDVPDRVQVFGVPARVVKENVEPH